MSKDICKKCDSFDGTCCQSGFAFPYEIECSDDHCDYFKEKQEQTLFQKLMQSEETLAEKLIHNHFDCDYGLRMYHSTIITDKWFASYREAYAATLEKLKEVDNA